MRIWQIAKRLGTESYIVIAVGRRYGFTIRSASSMLPPIAAQLLIEMVTESDEMWEWHMARWEERLRMFESGLS